MSEPGKPEYYCEKCGAPVDPTDEKCPNGHDLKEVGIQIKKLLEEKLVLNDTVSIVHNASQAVHKGINVVGIVLQEIKNDYNDLRATFDVNQEEISNKSDIPRKLDLLRDKMNQMGSNVEKMVSDVEKIKDQTTEPTSGQQVIADARSAIIGWIVAAIMTLIALFLGWKAFI